jgi:hypothetical protein
MANYCVECKFASRTSGDEVYCEKHQTWMNKYASCTDYIWIRARMLFRTVRALFSR